MRELKTMTIGSCAFSELKHLCNQNFKKAIFHTKI